jgi:hypothetical protein
VAIPLLVDDAIAAIIQLRTILENLKRANRKREEFEELDLPDGPTEWLMFDSMPPWAFSGNSTQSSDRLFGSAPEGQADNAGIERAKKQAERDRGKARKRWEDQKRKDPKAWAEFIAQLISASKSKNKRVAYNAKLLLGQLRQMGLI